MPARCWMAPEMPAATYSCGETVLPVWPTWCWCGYQPASVAAREAPTAAPRESARASMTREVLRRADPAAAGDDDRGLGQLGALALLLDHPVGDPGGLGGVGQRRP